MTALARVVGGVAAFLLAVALQEDAIRRYVVAVLPATDEQWFDIFEL